MKPSDVIKFITAVGVSELTGIFGALFTMPGLVTWYPSLRKPDWTPPDWVFGPVWISLYFLMGVSAFLVWRTGTKDQDTVVALSVFGAQLLFNLLWTVFFFGMKETGIAFIVIVGLWFMILFTMLLFWRISREASVLLIPYLLWVSFAAALNVVIFVSN